MKTCLTSRIAMTRLYLLAALCSLLFVVYCIAIAFHVGPFRDLWVDFETLRPLLDGQGNIGSLFTLHGGAHRLAVPRLFFLGEYYLFSGSNIYLIVVSCLAQASVVVLVWYLLCEETHLAHEQRILLVAMASLLMFNGTQLENFLYTFDMQWFLTAAAAVWALAGWVKLMIQVSEAKVISWQPWCSCTAWTAVSMFSSFAGVCILLVLPLIAAIVRLRVNIWIIVMAASAASICLYANGIGNAATAWIGIQGEWTLLNVIEFIFFLAALLGKWIILYLGSPLSRYSLIAASFVVAGSLLVVFWYCWKLLRQGRTSVTPFQLTCLTWCLFAVTVAAATGWGRMYFINTANEDRYQTITAIYWLGFFGFACSRAAMFPEKRRQVLMRGVLLVASVWTLVLLPWAGWRDAQVQVAFFDRVNTTNLAIATGQWEFNAIRDTLILGDKIKKINRPEMHAPWLKEKGWGVYSTKRYRMLGTTIDLTRVSADACEGELLAISPVGGGYHGYRLTGHARNVMDDNLPKDYIIVHPDGEVVGLGRLERDKTSLWPVSLQSSDTARWVAYTVDQPVGDVALEVLAERLSGGYCRITSV